MCGIGGLWSSQAITGAARTGALFADALAHRGPDGEGFLVVPMSGTPRLRKDRGELDSEDQLRGILVHRRLSIIDLATGDQPMGLGDGAAWIVYNGEIYNHLELRRELGADPTVQFRTTSDTEVILHVYRRWGVDGFRRLNGIFAFALYDAIQDALILARDPIGVKPLYWARIDGGVAFASEIRPLLAVGCAARGVSPSRLAEYLFYRFVPAPGTLWADIHKIVPGQALLFGRGGDVPRDIDFAAPPPDPVRTRPSLRAIADELAPALVEAVGRQMLADVPVGGFLSGGLDSSLVVASMRQKVAEVQTFAVGFPDNGGQPSELAIAERASRILGTTHLAARMDPVSYFARLPWAIAQVEEPVAHPGMLLQADLAALARRRVKVVLTGQGADEPLGGYPRHHAARLLPLISGVLRGVATSRFLNRWSLGVEEIARIRRVLAAPRGLERAAALFSALSPLDAGMMVRGTDPDEGRSAVLASLGRWWTRGDGLDDLARFLYVDVRTSLAEDLLLVADKTSMAHSLEARVPYLDLEYLRTVESLPGQSRIRFWGSRKRIQHEIARRLLPSELATHLRASSSPFRRKRGFDVPVNEWFRGTMNQSLMPFLVGGDSALPAFLDERIVAKIVAAYLKGSGAAYRRVLSLYVLEIWLRNFLKVAV